MVGQGKTVSWYRAVRIMAPVWHLLHVSITGAGSSQSQELPLLPWDLLSAAKAV